MATRVAPSSRRNLLLRRRGGRGAPRRTLRPRACDGSGSCMRRVDHVLSCGASQTNRALVGALGEGIPDPAGVSSNKASVWLGPAAALHRSVHIGGFLGSQEILIDRPARPSYGSMSTTIMSWSRMDAQRQSRHSRDASDLTRARQFRDIVTCSRNGPTLRHHALRASSSRHRLGFLRL